MATQRWIAFIAFSLVLSALVGCGATAPSLTSQSTEQVRAAARRPNPPTLTTAAMERASSQVRRLAGDALYRYEDLRREWLATPSDWEKDRIEQQMVTVLSNGLQDVRRATYSSYAGDARRVHELATRTLERHESLRRDWQYAYGDREKRLIVNEMLTLLTGALMDIRDR